MYNLFIITIKMTKGEQTFFGIMFFYALLTYVIFPLIFYFGGNKSLLSAGHGFAVGSIISILLWYSVGSNMIKPEKY